MAGDAFELRSELLGALPIVNHFLARMRLGASLERFVPDNDARLRLPPAVVLGVVVRNLVTHREPVYALGEWAAGYEPGLFDLFAGDVTALNDDRVGRTLKRLFDADRASLLTEVVVNVVREFDVDCRQLHNDSTSVTFTGADYPGGGTKRGGKTVPAVSFGHNKDHRPDLLTELREESSQVRDLTVAWGLRVLGRARRQSIPGSRLADRAVGGVVGRDRRRVRALSAV